MQALQVGCRMNIRRFIAVASLLAVVAAASAQIRIIPREVVEEAASPAHSADSAFMSFDTRHIAAAPMCEDDAPATFVYTFRNTGTDTLHIERLVATCSCMSVKCDSRAVAPDGIGTISVRYDPKGHPGRFERKVFVYTAGEDSPAAVLKLSVNVENGTDMSVSWPVQMGGIRMRTAETGFRKGVRAVERIIFINLTGKPLALECERMFLPEYLSFRTEPEVVEDGHEGEMVISYDPSDQEERESVKIILKGLGLPPSKSTIKVNFK